MGYTVLFDYQGILRPQDANKSVVPRFLYALHNKNASGLAPQYQLQMKKIYSCIPAILTGILQLSAQDIITKCNGEEIEAKVTEIGDTQIRYRKYENPKGALYNIPASEVFVIRFEDGTREVITPLDGASQASARTAAQPAATGTDAAPTGTNDNYAQINRTVKKTKEPLRDKYFYIGPRVEFGYAAITAKSENISGPLCSAGVIAEYMIDKMSPHGAGAGVSYDMYMLEDDFDLNYVNIDLYYVYRPRSRWSFFAGFKFGIPTKSEASGVDLKTVTNTTAGIEMGAGWATRHFDLGAALFTNFNKTLDVSEHNQMVGIKLRIAYRF